MAIWRTQVRMDYPGDGGPGFNTWHLRDATDPITAGFPAAFAGYLEEFYGEVASLMENDTTITHDGVWTGVGPDVGLVAETDPWNTVGIRSSGNLPEILCVNLRWGTDRPGRTGRGRHFLGPLSQFALGANGNLGSTAPAVVSNAAAALIAANSADDGGAFGVWSPSAGVISDYTSASVPSEFSYLSTRRD